MTAPLIRAGERIICPNGHFVCAFEEDVIPVAGYEHFHARKTWGDGQERHADGLMQCARCNAWYWRAAPIDPAIEQRASAFLAKPTPNPISLDYLAEMTAILNELGAYRHGRAQILIEGTWR